MAKARTKSANTIAQMPPALDPDVRQRQLIARAVDLAEQQLIDGTASSAVITHYLKLGTMESKYKLKEMERNVKLLEAKANRLDESKVNNELYSQVLAAMKIYRGEDEE